MILPYVTKAPLATTWKCLSIQIFLRFSPAPDFTVKLKVAIENQKIFKDKNRDIYCNRDKERDIFCKTGKIWTTDAIYRETSKKVAFFRNMGAIAVEMECSALFAVANYRKIDIAAILIVSDELSSSKWKPGFKTAAFKESRKKILNAIIGIL
ncbi:MAG: hypothetical protein HQK67_04340 [Desulfamplus sp.]|nr:hypothetical protein [Desulfamplus sp.]